MSRNLRATKRQGGTMTNAGKRQKLSLSDNDETQKIIYPKTSTTKTVIEKFVNHRLQKHTEDKASNMDKYSPINIKSPAANFSNSKNFQSADKTESNSLNVDKYSPKNIESPTTIKSNSLKSIHVLNKKKFLLQNIPLVCSPISSCSNTYSSEKMKSSIRLGVSSENRGCSKMDISERQTSASICSAHSTKISTNASEERKCGKYEEEEFSLFFRKLIPYASALNEEKKREFKAQVVTSLQKLIGGELQELT